MCLYFTVDLSYSQLLEDNSDIVRTLKSTLVLYMIPNRGVVFWDQIMTKLLPNSFDKSSKDNFTYNFTYLIDACKILKFLRERKNSISPTETTTFISLRDLKVPTLTLLKISLNVRQLKTSSTLQHFNRANKSVKSL